MSSKLLVHYDPDFSLQLAGDGSEYGIGAIISHVFPDGSKKLIPFASRTLEQNYAQLENEALSWIFGVQKIPSVLVHAFFRVVQDHTPLTTIFGSKVGIPPLAAARLPRWALLL